MGSSSDDISLSEVLGFAAGYFVASMLEPPSTVCSHKIHKLWLGDSDEALVFGVGVKYKNITCNTAPAVVQHALQYIEKKAGGGATMRAARSAGHQQ